MMFNKRLLALVPGAMRHVLANVLWQWVSLWSNILLIGSICRLLGAAFAGQPMPVQATAIACGVALVARFVAAKCASRQAFLASKQVKRVLREKIYQKLLRLGPSYAQSVPTAEVVQLSVEGVDQLETYFGGYLPQFFYALLAPLTLFAVLCPVRWQAALVLLVCVPLIPMAIVVVQKIAKRLLAKYWGQYAQLGDSFLENLQGLTTLKIYQADEERHRKMNQEAEHFRVVTMKVLTMQLNSIIVMDIVALGGAALGMLVALVCLANGSVDITGCLLILLLSSDFFLPMRTLGSFFHVAMNGMAASDKIFRVLDLQEPVPGTKAVGADTTIALRDVHFGYEAEREVLHGVSLTVPMGGMTALVGASGSGKSTIGALLSGRVTGACGSLTLGGVPLAELSGESLAKTVTTISQNCYLFKGTVRENLLLAAPAAADEALWRALEQVELADFLRQQQGLDTALTEQAANLSGGQRQRLALARALLHDSPVYLFDEATSNIDAESEEKIMAVIQRLAEHKTVVLISHRLLNVVRADNIYVLENGSLVGSGTHDHLLESCPCYKALWQEQQLLEAYAGRNAQ